MPELPEVEIYRQRFDACALRKRIEHVEVTDRRILYRTSLTDLRRVLEGQRFTGTRRHGKHLFARVGSGAWLYLHFGMSGDLHCGRDVPRFARVVIRFASRSLLAFEDMRLFGRVGLVHDPQALIAEKRLGLDPLDAEFGMAEFEERLAGRRGSVKALLMNQSVLAGLGNLWVDEILFQTGIHPRARAERLSPRLRREVFVAMRRILRSAIERQAKNLAMSRTWLIENRTVGARCTRCREGTLGRSVVAGRTTYFCAAHQRR